MKNVRTIWLFIFNTVQSLRNPKIVLPEIGKIGAAKKDPIDAMLTASLYGKEVLFGIYGAVHCLFQCRSAA